MNRQRVALVRRYFARVAPYFLRVTVTSAGVELSRKPPRQGHFRGAQKFALQGKCHIAPEMDSAMEFIEVVDGQQVYVPEFELPEPLLPVPVVPGGFVDVDPLLPQ